MAALAQRDQEKRTIEVQRQRLIETLKENREKHIRDYEEAMAGYKETLLEKIETAFAEARVSIEDQYNKLKAKVAGFTESDISSQGDYFTILDDIIVEMTVPRSYAKEYDAAIDMAIWDVRETLELTHAEFTCFVRDQWAWRSSFDAVSSMYNNKMAR